MHLRSIRTPRRTMVSALLVVVLSACSSDAPVTGERATQVASRVRDLKPSAIRPEEQSFDEIARTAPGFGGYFVAANGDLVAWVKGTADDAAVQSLVSNMKPRLALEAGGRAVRDIQIRRAQFTFRELAALRDMLFDQALGKVSGLHGLDLDEAANRVAVYISPPQAVEASSTLRALVRNAGFDSTALLLRAENTPTFATASARSLERVPPQASTLSDAFAPLVGGIQWNASGQNPCSAGVIVDYNSVRGMMSATHCSATPFVIDGGVGYQPASSGRSFGSETADPSGSNCINYKEFPPTYRPCRFSDAAFWAMNGVVWSEKGLIARTQWKNGPGGTSDGSKALDVDRPYFIINGTAGSLSVGGEVHKMGWRTGWTWGYITDTCYDSWDPNFGRLFKCQYVADMRVDGGDSGGSVFQLDGLIGDATLTGIVSARKDDGATIFSPWWRVSDEFGGGLQATRGYNLTTPSTSGAVNGTAPVVTWPAVNGATKYEVFRQWFVKATGESGDDNLGFQSSGFVDYGMSVSSYNGTTRPPFYTPGNVAYYVIARNDTDRSVNSTWIYFMLNP